MYGKWCSVLAQHSLSQKEEIPLKCTYQCQAALGWVGGIPALGNSTLLKSLDQSPFPGAKTLIKSGQIPIFG